MKCGLLLCLLATASGCQQGPVPQDAKADSHSADPGTNAAASAGANEVYGPPTRIGVLQDPTIRESSGIVASRTTPGMYWTHNDSGDGPFIYAFDNRGGRRGTWRVTGATARDWEDIAAGPGPTPGTKYLYIGDIGDNGNRHSEIIVYRIPEPAIAAADADSKKNKPQSTEPAEVIRLRYPDGKHDAEALLVHPVTGNIYIVTKVPFEKSTIYGANAPFIVAGTTKLVRLGELEVPSLFGGMITGGDISPDGRRVALCDYVQGYEVVLPETGMAFDGIWKLPLTAIALGEHKQGEAIGYRLDGKALLTTSEGRPATLSQVARR